MGTTRITNDELCGLERLLRRYETGEESDTAVLEAMKARGHDLVLLARRGLAASRRGRGESTPDRDGHSPAQWYKDL